MDRFNRPIISRWRKDLSGSVKPEPVRFSIGYRRDGGVKYANDLALAAGKSVTPSPVFDFRYKFGSDGLAIVSTQFSQGEYDSTTNNMVSSATLDSQDTRELWGKATRQVLNLDSNGAIRNEPGANWNRFGEWDDVRTYNKRNELVKREASAVDVDLAPFTETFNLVYDKNGNLTNTGDGSLMMYAPVCYGGGKGGPVEVQVSSTSATVEQMIYNSSGDYSGGKSDVNDAGNTGVPDGSVNGSDATFYYATDANGRRTATFRGSDTYPKETYVYHPAGLHGPGIISGVMLRDRNADLFTDPTKWARVAGDADRLERLYYATDFRGSPAALVWADGTMAEQVRYDQNGVPKVIPKGDVNGDGSVDGNTANQPNPGDPVGVDYDQTDWMAANSAVRYHVRGDLDLDGDVDTTDRGVVQATDGVGVGRGEGSSAAAASVFATQGATQSTSLVRSALGSTVYFPIAVTTVPYQCRFPDPGAPGGPGTPDLPTKNINGCPLWEPDGKIGDGWCHDTRGGGHCGLKCYRSYPNPGAGQQCCYLPSGLLDSNRDCMGTLDLYGCDTGENSDGSCNGGYPGCLLDHYLYDYIPYTRCKRHYNELQCCLRQRGIPSGSPGGPVSHCDMEYAYSSCIDKVYRQGQLFCSPISAESCSDPTYVPPMPRYATCFAIP